MKKAFSQNGRRNIAVVVDLLFLNESLCAITTSPLNGSCSSNITVKCKGNKKKHF